MERLAKSDQLRLAICALRFKPEDQSITAYVLELRDGFPPYGSCYADGVSWRSLALKLEGENKRLREQLDTEKIRYLDLASKGDSSTPVIDSNTSGSGSGLVNEKTKKTRKKVTSNHNLLPCLEHARNDDCPASGILFPAMDAFSRLLSLEASAIPQDLFLSTICRSVEAVADSLDSLLFSTTLQKKNHKKHLEILNITLQYVLVHGIPPLVRFSKRSKRKRKRDVKDSESQEDDPLDRFFALLQSRILSRIITTTCRLSRNYLTGLLLSNADASYVDGQASRATDRFQFQEALGDLRAGVMALFESSAHLLFADPPSVGAMTDQIFTTKLSELRASLALETVSELDRVIFGNPVHASAVPASTVPDGCYSVRGESIGVGPSSYAYQRVERLVIKDAVWYLCHVMHSLLGRSNSAFMEGQAEHGGSPGGVNVKGIHNQRASIVSLETAQDMLFRLMIKCRKEIMAANSFDSSLDIYSHATEHELKGRTGQENPIGADEFSDGRQQTGWTTVSDVGKVMGGKKEVVYDSGGMGQSARPMIDEVTYNMLMGVVERFVLCKYLS